MFAAQFILEDAKNYTFMTMGGLRVPGIEDPEEFNQTIASMKVITNEQKVHLSPSVVF